MANAEDMRTEDPGRDDRDGVAHDGGGPLSPSSDAANASDVPSPPAPPSVTRDYRDLADEAARIQALRSDRERRSRRTRVAALGMAAAGIALLVAGALAALATTHPLGMPGVQDDTSAVQDAPVDDSPEEESPSSAGTEDESISAVEAVVAADQINASFAALSSDTDGAFSEYVRAFMDDYDRGVNRETSYAFSDLGIDTQELSQALIAGFSCSVIDIDVHGGTAWVTLEVASKGLADQADAFARAVEESGGGLENEEEYKAFLKESYLAAFDDISPRSHSLLVTVEKSNDGWKVTDATMEYVLGSVWYTSA